VGEGNVGRGCRIGWDGGCRRLESGGRALEAFDLGTKAVLRVAGREVWSE
jgi:hypothetical protein